MSVAYRRGADAERRLRRVLQAAGWLVLRSAGSHSPCDLAAWDEHGALWLIQVKQGPGRGSRTAQAALQAWAARTRGWAAIAHPGPRGQWRIEVWEPQTGVWVTHGWPLAERRSADG
jgi:Holliday junction resolvase